MEEEIVLMEENDVEEIDIQEENVVNATGNANYTVGDVYITSTNENPSLRLGGEWN